MQSCTINENEPQQLSPDNDTISEVFEVTKSFNIGNQFSNLITYPIRLFPSDVVLVYRLTNLNPSSTDIWQPLPKTYYFANGSRDFSFEYDFTQLDLNIYIAGNDLTTLPNEFKTNQTFRIVIVPANFANKNSKLDLLSYKEIIAKYKIDDTKIKSLDY